jgi:hypothetical protein
VWRRRELQGVVNYPRIDGKDEATGPDCNGGTAAVVRSKILRPEACP